MPVARTVVGVLVASLLAASPCRSQERQTLTLATAESAARQQNPAIAAALLRADVAGHRAEQAGKWPNPELSAYRESFPAAVPDADQWIVSVSQRLRIGGQLGLAADAAEADRAAYRNDAAALRSEVVLQVRRAYVTAHAAQRKIELLTEAIGAASDLLRDMETRRDEGDVSDFDVQRLRLEVEALRARAADLRVEAENATTTIAALTGLPVPDGGWRFAPPDEQPEGPPPLGEVDDVGRQVGSGAAGDGPHVDSMNDGGAPATVTDHPTIRAAVDRRRAAGIRRELADREALPDLDVTAGYSDLDPDLDGFVWSVSAVIPIFDRNRGEVAAMAVEEARLERRIESLERELSSRRSRALASYRTATETLQQLGPDTEGGLTDAARIGYEEGEMSVAELLDAVQAGLSARMLRAELERRRADGWFVWRWAGGGTAEEVVR